MNIMHMSTLEWSWTTSAVIKEGVIVGGTENEHHAYEGASILLTHTIKQEQNIIEDKEAKEEGCENEPFGDQYSTQDLNTILKEELFIEDTKKGECTQELLLSYQVT